MTATPATPTAAAKEAAAARRSLEGAARAMNGAIIQAGTRGSTFAGANHDSRAVAPGPAVLRLPG
jgi:hypothetical protein